MTASPLDTARALAGVLAPLEPGQRRAALEILTRHLREDEDAPKAGPWPAPYCPDCWEHRPKDHKEGCACTRPVHRYATFEAQVDVRLARLRAARGKIDELAWYVRTHVPGGRFGDDLGLTQASLRLREAGLWLGAELDDAVRTAAVL